MAQSRKEHLVRQLEAQREDLAGRFQSLKAELEPGHQLRLSLRRHPVRWTLGAAGSAFLATRLLRRRKMVFNPAKKRGGLVIRTLKFAFFLSRPALTAIALRKVQEHLETHLNRSSRNSMLGGSSQK